MSFLSLIILVISCLTFTLLYIDMNPASTIHFAKPQSRIPLIKLIVKITLPLYITLDFKQSLNKEFIVLLLATYAFLVYSRFKFPACYNKKIANVQLVCDACLLWITFCITVHAFIDDNTSIDNTGVFYAIFGACLVGVGLVLMVD